MGEASTPYPQWDGRGRERDRSHGSHRNTPGSPARQAGRNKPPGRAVTLSMKEIVSTGKGGRAGAQNGPEPNDMHLTARPGGLAVDVRVFDSERRAGQDGARKFRLVVW
jgi:hypothetical protein